MKKSIFVILVIICLMLVSCVAETIGTSSDVGEESVAGENNVLQVNDVELQYVNNYISSRYNPKANNVDDITDEECEELAYDVYDEVFCIVKEFYGFPEYLRIEPGEYPANEIPYTEVYVNPNPNDKYPVVFENNAESIKATVDKYFTDALIKLAFSLDKPCPIYEENGKLYRTEYETNTAYAGCDISAGRILFRENGIVRYGFPIYFLDYETHEPDTDFWTLGYMDFAYEDSAWKVDDLRLSSVHYSADNFPGGKADIRMDDFFETTDEAQFEGITASLKNGKEVFVTVSGHTVSEKLTVTASKVRKIEASNGNVFVSVLGAFGETETLVISEKEGTVISKFISNGYCITKNGDWFYTKINRETLKGEVFDKNNKAVSGYQLVKQDSGEHRALPEIAPIEKMEYNDGKIEITYDVTAY